MFRILFAVLFTTLLGHADNPTVLVTGGAGYIGSHTCKALYEAGFTPVVYDSLVFGKEERVKWGPLHVGDVNDVESLEKVFEEYKPVAVIHFAGLRDIGASIEDPATYYETNLIGTINLIKVMRKSGTKYVIFSSTGCVYGDVVQTKLEESHVKEPINPYSRSKRMSEIVLENCSKAYDLSYVILRYFNAAGVDYKSGLKRCVGGDKFLIPIILSSLGKRELCIFGDDYPTDDGTPVRDYIHVQDLANAHVLALKHLLKTHQSDVFNLGTGRGYSVKEVIQATQEVTGQNVKYRICPRKEGDLPETVADPSRAKKVLGFTPKHSDIHTMIQSEWEAIR